MSEAASSGGVPDAALRPLAESGSDAAPVDGPIGLSDNDSTDASVVPAYTDATIAADAPNSTKGRCNPSSIRDAGTTPVLPDRNAIVWAKILPAIKGCYQRGFAKAPEMSGRLWVAFEICQDGSVASVAIKARSGSLTEEVVGCMLRVIEHTRFPRGVGTGTFTIPLAF
jgi:hypothetical protein